MVIEDVKVLNSLITGPSLFNVAVGIFGDGSTSGIEITDCVMQGGQIANLYFAGVENYGPIVGCTVKHNTIQNGQGDGILTDPGSIAGCSFLENLIANNCGRAMYIAENCNDNLAAQNKAFRNGDDLIDDGTNNLFDDNTEFNNKLICGECRVERHAKVQVDLKLNTRS